MAVPLRSSVDWRVVKNVALRIGEIAPDFLEENVLIGGSAAWYYRQLLELSNDADFPPVVYPCFARKASPFMGEMDSADALWRPAF
jgi:hypothetical protein